MVSLTPHWYVTLPLSSFCRFSSKRDDPSHSFVHPLRQTAKVWFNKIPPGTIADFEQFSKGFVHHFIEGQRHKKPIGHLLNIQQVEGESLRQYVTRFNKELLQVDEKIGRASCRERVLVAV